jgi:uncharacterized membrane protein YidH (DUF202 family)
MIRRAQRARWLVVVVFAAGMAWVEAASVYYLRVLVDRVEPYQAAPLPLKGTLTHVELVREAATLVMLLTLGTLGGRTTYARLGYTAIAFGVWDILYYAFLWIICGWPRSLFDWDVLFLLPLPWWGPVLAPCCIAALMIAWGTCATQRRGNTAGRDFGRTRLGLTAVGIALALYVFMADSLRAVHEGRNVGLVLPEAFNWWLFSAALILMGAPLARFRRRPRTPDRHDRKQPMLGGRPQDRVATRCLT